MIEDINSHIDHHTETIGIVKDALIRPISECAQLLIKALRDGRKILVMGNGGSAADAQHFAAEMVGRFLTERKALPAIALTTDTSILTAVSNDYGFEDVFKRQVEALARPGDVLIGISTSGHSKNVVRALQTGREIGATTVGVLGRDGGKISSLVDLELTVPCQSTPHVQEMHLVIIHILCGLVEKALSRPDFK